MKKRKANLIVIIVTVACVLFVGYIALLFISFQLTVSNSKETHMTVSGSAHRDPNEPIGDMDDIREDPDSVYKNHLDTNLPYWDYKHKMDSIHWVQHYYTSATGGGFGCNFFGVARYEDCDTCTYTNTGFGFDPAATPHYYFAAYGFKLPDDQRAQVNPPVFYYKLGKSFVKYIRYDSVSLYDGNRIHFGHWESKQIGYRVDDEGGLEKRKRVLIPVSEKWYNILTISCYVIFVVYVLAFGLVLRNFILVLIDLARGKAFTINNYRRLFIVAYIIAAAPLSMFTVQVLLQQVFRSYYKGDLLTDMEWSNKISYLVTALAIFLVAGAFRKGYRIQQEQDLTI